MTKVQHISEQIEKVRIMGRQIGRVLTDEEMNAVSGGDWPEMPTNFTWSAFDLDPGPHQGG